MQKLQAGFRHIVHINFLCSILCIIKISIALHIHLQMRKKETKLDYTRFYVHENLQDVVSLKKGKKA